MTRLCVRDEDVVALFAADCGRFVKRPYGFVRRRVVCRGLRRHPRLAFCKTPFARKANLEENRNYYCFACRGHSRMPRGRFVKRPYKF